MRSQGEKTMKTVILAGGFGTRISEESRFKPKPMVELGGRPILWHIMKHFSSFGFNDFIICAGYRQEAIKDFFADYFLHRTDVTFDFTMGDGRVEHHCSAAEPWRVTVADTGLNTMTGGRIRRIARFLDDGPFFLTYGDGVSNVDLKALLDCHRMSGRTVTLTAVNPGQRFGTLDLNENGGVVGFREKAARDGMWINGGFMVCENALTDLIEGDETVLEKEPLETLARTGGLGAYRHTGFWQQMDTAAERDLLNRLWREGNAPWKTWSDNP